ncbi:MAG: L-rhamnose/proton symporter RhaT [Dysgonamonadaceae bacterium]|jgi:L-rhamnose-H+ transport protein|nr:L-rhamnose/proton symporter RhaT [Dysgonamonadaceae bacterium]
MNTIIGLIIIAVGSFGQSSSYVPIKKIKDWAWECFWLTQGVFAWLLFPSLGALLAVPDGYTLLGVIGSAGTPAVLKTIGFGMLWGVGGLTFGLSMRYLGVAMGQSIALGTCSAFGTLIPALIAGENLFTGKGLILLIAVSIAIAGIAVIGYAGALRSQNMSEEEKKKAVKDFALKKGLLIALLAGVMSACFNLGLESGVTKHMEVLNVSGLYEGLPATLLVTIGGFIINAVYCIYQNVKNRTGKQYFSVPGNVLFNNLLFCALAGILWYSQFFGKSVGESFFDKNSLMLAFSWSILMSLNVLFSNVWGILLKEWKGAGKKAVTTLVVGLFVLILSIIFTGVSQQKDTGAESPVVEQTQTQP